MIYLEEEMVGALENRLMELEAMPGDEYERLVGEAVARSADRYIDRLLTEPRPVRTETPRTPEKLAYEYGIPKRNRERWEDRLNDGEGPEEIAKDLSTWSRFRRRSRYS
ncbi:hypothetical protein L5G28_16375 [Gordonia sp. HY285]|uniref:hypothetical protein n=1 Tax=Gordonia liuliyuniae TaxID=2911517 RepID=UPI001F485908|nr:hypothetical protein [Gordonia liuliyuniae]MCF8611723.1 hypothetical protein [Gordonia liuliyuniae]